MNQVRAARIRVVLADDHPVVRDGLAAIVNQQVDMVVVGEAGDGEEAIALFHALKPDVMVLDLRMPKHDGVTVVQRVIGRPIAGCGDVGVVVAFVSR